MTGTAAARRLELAASNSRWRRGSVHIVRRGARAECTGEALACGLVHHDASDGCLAAALALATTGFIRAQALRGRRR
jgi:hypothetical protein